MNIINYPSRLTINCLKNEIKRTEKEHFDGVLFPLTTSTLCRSTSFASWDNKSTRKRGRADGLRGMWSVAWDRKNWKTFASRLNLCNLGGEAKVWLSCRLMVLMLEWIYEDKKFVIIDFGLWEGRRWRLNRPFSVINCFTNGWKNWRN